MEKLLISKIFFFFLISNRLSKNLKLDLDHWHNIIVQKSFVACLKEFNFLPLFCKGSVKQSCDRSGVYVSKMCMW